MNLKLWRIVERFCRGQALDPEAFGAFAQLVEDDQEAAIRKKIKKWNDEELEQFSFLISGTLDTVDHPHNPDGVLQCQGLYVVGSHASLTRLGSKEIPKHVRLEMADSVSHSLPNHTKIIIGSHIVPVTWVHGFGWKQWRAALARDPAMFSRPNAQPTQAPESQAWILPVFLEKGLFTIDLQADVSEAGVSALGKKLAAALAQAFEKVEDVLPADVSIHPILAAAHSCWPNAKAIAVHQWAKATQDSAHALGRAVVFEEAPRRGSVRARDAQTGRLIAELKADASFPVDGTRMVIDLIMKGWPAR